MVKSNLYLIVTLCWAGWLVSVFKLITLGSLVSSVMADGLNPCSVKYPFYDNHQLSHIYLDFLYQTFTRIEALFLTRELRKIKIRTGDKVT